MLLLVILALGDARRHHSRRRRSRVNSAIDDLRGTSSDMGNIEAEVLFPQRKKSHAREIELMRLLNDLVSPRPESIARRVKKSGEALSRKYLQELAEALQNTGKEVSQARKFKAMGERAKRLVQLDRPYDAGSESFVDSLKHIAGVLGINV